MNKAILYVHGKGGNAQEAERYKAIFPEYDVFGADYRGDAPWETKEEILSALSFFIIYKSKSYSTDLFFSAAIARLQKNIEISLFTLPANVI